MKRCFWCNTSCGISDVCSECSDTLANKAFKPRPKIKVAPLQSTKGTKPPRSRKSIIQYGITVEFFNELVVGQNNSCAICGTHEDKLTKRLNIDHEHGSGKVRGLLCSMCNTGIGMLKEDETILENAIRYLNYAKKLKVAK